MKWEMLHKNPADAVDPPKLERTSMSTYDMAQTVELLERAAGSRLIVPVMLGVLCGLRRGEIVALRWRNVDLASAQIAVVESAEQTATGVRYKPPKSGRSLTVGRRRREASRAPPTPSRRAAQALRQGHRRDVPLHPRDGEPVQPRTLTQAWQQLLASTGLPRIRFHDLRHAHATHLLASGVHPRVASEPLGHSKVGITLDLYSHVLPGMQADAAARVDEAMRLAIEKRSSEPPKNDGEKGVG